MALRGIKPESVQKRLKVLFYGGAGAGKTTAAINFPQPYLIDTEKGAVNDQYVEILKNNNGVIFQTTDFEDLIMEVKSLLSEKHPYKTLIIDPLTTIYNDLLDKCALKNGTDFGRHYSEANKRMKNLLNLLLKLDLNVIITSHSKNEYGQNMAVLGQTFDCYKKLDFLFDLVFEVQKRGKERIGIIKKSRIESFPDGETFPFCYEEIAKRYGKEILEKDSVSIQLASSEQIKELKRLIEVLHIDEESKLKILKKEEVEDFDYLSSLYIQKCINHFKSKIQGEVS